MLSDVKMFQLRMLLTRVIFIVRLKTFDEAEDVNGEWMARRLVRAGRPDIYTRSKIRRQDWLQHTISLYIVSTTQMHVVTYRYLRT